LNEFSYGKHTEVPTTRPVNLFQAQATARRDPE
jgi:hypothetical protein